jgi:hypothetical protein
MGSSLTPHDAARASAANGPSSQPPATLPPHALPPRALADSAVYEAPTRPAAGAPEVDAARGDVDRSGAADHPLVLRLPVGTRLADAERKLILLTLEAVRGNKQRAARVLGISRRGLYSKLQAYGEHVGAQEAPVDSAEEPVSTSEPAVTLDADAPASIVDMETPPLSEESPHAAIHEDETPQAECPG